MEMSSVGYRVMCFLTNLVVKTSRHQNLRVFLLRIKFFSENCHLVACLRYCSATANWTLIRKASWKSCCSGMLLCMTPYLYLNLHVYLSVCLRKMSLYYDELSCSGEHTWSLPTKEQEQSQCTR